MALVYSETWKWLLIIIGKASSVRSVEYSNAPMSGAAP